MYGFEQITATYDVKTLRIYSLEALPRASAKRSTADKQPDDAPTTGDKPVEPSETN